MRKFPHQIYTFRMPGFVALTPNTPVRHTTWMPNPPGGIAWLDRGFWCALLMRGARLSWHICTDASFTRSGHALALDRPAHEITRRQAARETVGQLAAQFPAELRPYAITELSRVYAHLQLGADGIPWEIHAIENRKAREAAARAFKENS